MSTSTHREVRFHIIHNYTSLNRGCAAIVLSTTKAIRERIPNAGFTIESYHPHIDKKLYNTFGVKVIKKVVSSPAKAAILFVIALSWRILSNFGLHITRLIGLDQLATYYDSNMILDLAGDNLCIPFSVHSTLFKFQRNIFAIMGHTYLFLLCMLLKKPIVIYAQTIGPLGIMRPLIKTLLNKVSLISVREEDSLHYLAKIGINGPQIHLTADPAFSLPSTSDDEIDEILQKEKVNTEIPIVGMCISSETAKYHYKNGERKFTELFATVADNLVDEYNAQVVLIPFSTWKGHGGDDRVISRRIHELTKRKKRVKLIKGEYSPIELKGIISRCNMFIGSRGHSCILALSSCVPTVAIGHNPKYYGIMRMVGQEHYVCKAQELTYESIISLIYHLWSNQEMVKKELESKIKLMRDLATLNAELVKNILLEERYLKEY